MVNDGLVNDRGLHSRYARMWLLRRFGEDGLRRVLVRLSPQAKRMMENPVPHAWYPSTLNGEVYQAIESEFSEHHPDVLLSLGRFIAQRSISGFLNFLVRLSSVKTIIKRIEAIWHRYHDGGKAEARITKQQGKHKEGLLIIRGYDAGPQWCQTITGFTEAMINSTGARNVKVEKKDCIHQGNDTCSWYISFEE